jgi:hypothetical protein
MRRLWALVCLLGLVAVALGASSVLAGSTKTASTYWNNTVSASSFSASVNPVARPNQPDGTWYWLGYGGSAAWTFDVAAIPALNGSLALNLVGLSTSLQTGGGAGYDTAMKITVAGVGATTLSGTLNNPWQPHVAFNYAAPTGWLAFASVLVPTSVWRGARVLTVTVQSTTSNTFMGVNRDALRVAYTSVG